MIHYKMISTIFFLKNVLSFCLLEKKIKQCSQFVCVGIFKLSYQNHIIVATRTFKWYSFLIGNVISFNLSEFISPVPLKIMLTLCNLFLSVDASVVFVCITDAPNLLYSVCKLVNNTVFESCRVARTFVSIFDQLVSYTVWN